MCENISSCIAGLCPYFQCLDDRIAELIAKSGSQTVHSLLDMLCIYASSGMPGTAVCPDQTLVLLITSNKWRHQLS